MLTTNNGLIKPLIYFVYFSLCFSFRLSYFFTTDAIRFHYFLCKVKSDGVTDRRVIFFGSIAFDFNMLFDLNSNPNNFIETLFIRVFLVDCLIFLNNSLIVLKISEYLEGLIPNKLTSKFLFYFFLSFYFGANISVIVSIFINFYCELITIKM